MSNVELANKYNISERNIRSFKNLNSQENTILDYFTSLYWCNWFSEGMSLGKEYMPIPSDSNLWIGTSFKFYKKTH